MSGSLQSFKGSSGAVPRNRAACTSNMNPYVRRDLVLEYLCLKIINSVHTRCIVKTSGFTRGVCKNQGFY